MDQASLIRAVVDHPALVAASALAGLLSTKEQAASSYVSEHTVRMLGRARSNEKVRGKSKREKHVFSAIAIRAGTCARWSANDIPHWDCQTLQCAVCKEYPVPAEEAREDAGAEDILFHVYEYKVLLRQDGKEQQQLELVQKRTTIGKFHRLFYGPALGRGRYHMNSYKLAARC